MGDLDPAYWVRPFQVMEWSNEASLALVEEYRKQPVLWDVRHQSYSSKSQKQEAWEAIAAGMQLDVHEVRQKMNSLLGSFRREKSKLKRNRESVNGQNYFSKWFAFEKMQFLLRDDETDPMGVKMEDEDDFIFEELRYPIPEPPEPAPSEKRTSISYAPPPKRSRKFLKPMPDSIPDDVSVDQNQDEYWAFGQYIACKLRKFDARTRAFVEHAVNKVLFEADLGKYDNMPSPFGSSQQNWAGGSNQVVSDPLPEAPSLNNIGEGT